MNVEEYAGTTVKRQTRPWRCGPATVRNTLRAFGMKVSEDSLAALCDCDETGTDEQGILYALKYHGFKTTEYLSNSKKNAFQWLHGSLLHGEAVILCIQSFEHWVVAVGSLGDRVVVVDPSNFKVNASELNTHVWTRQWLMRQWFNARKSIEGQERLYAIAVGKPR